MVLLCPSKICFMQNESLSFELTSPSIGNEDLTETGHLLDYLFSNPKCLEDVVSSEVINCIEIKLNEIKSSLSAMRTATY